MLCPERQKAIKEQTNIPPIDDIESLIRTVRGQKAILDEELARIYNVPTHRFNELGKRNREHLPEGLRFQLTQVEWKTIDSLRSQFATLKAGCGRHGKFDILDPPPPPSEPARRQVASTLAPSNRRAKPPR